MIKPLEMGDKDSKITNMLKEIEENGWKEEEFEQKISLCKKKNQMYILDLKKAEINNP